MELLELMKTRRSVREYTDEKVTDDQINAILHAGMLSPTGKAIKPWEFIVVKDADTIRKMRNCRAGGAKMFDTANAVIIVLGKTEDSDVWTEDCSAVLTSMHLMAHALGLGSCWVQGRLRKTDDGTSTSDYLRDMFHFPETFEVQAALTVGHPVALPKAHTIEELPMEKVHYETF